MGDTHPMLLQVFKKSGSLTPIASREFEFGGSSTCLFVSPEVLDLAEQFITAPALPSFGVGVEICNETQMVFVEVHVHRAFMRAGAHIYRFCCMFNPVSHELVNVDVYIEKVLHFRDVTELDAFELLDPFVKAPLI